MKLRILFSLALVSGGHCFAGIIYPQAPDGGQETVAKYLDAQSLKYLKVSRIQDLTIARPFEEYYVTNLTNLSSGNFLSAAKSGLWVYPLMQGTNAVGEIGLVTDKQSGTGLKFNYLKETVSTNTTMEGLRIAEQLSQINNQDYEFRRLNLAPVLFRSVWLHGKSDDILIPLPPTFGRWNAYQPCSESQMLVLLKPEVEKVRNAWKSPTPDFQATHLRAELGDAKSQYNLAIMYFKGDGVAQDYATAAQWFAKAADQGEIDSEYNLAVCYEQGKGMPQDYAKALEWYQQAAKGGNLEAAVNLGVIYFHGQGVAQDYTNALKWLRTAADGGLPVACDYVGMFYAKGYGVAADSKEAVKWYRQAADKGSAWAQTELGVRFTKGDGVKKNGQKAVHWTRLAADQGFAQAQFNLGSRYMNGWGVATNQVEAAKWFRLAADQGHALAQRNLGICYILGQGVDKDDAEAYKWLTLSALHGESTADTARSQFSQDIAPKSIYEGMRRADAFVPHPKDFPDEPR